MKRLKKMIVIKIYCSQRNPHPRHHFCPQQKTKKDINHHIQNRENRNRRKI